MTMRTITRMAGAGAVAVGIAACSGLPPAVRGLENPPGQATVAAEMRMSDGARLTAGMAPGTASYMGASADGSLMGFLTADGSVRWYKVR